MNEVKFLNIRRCVAVFMAMLITVLSLSYTNNNHANATNSSITYFVYDAKTAEKIPNRNYILTKLSSSDNTRAVIGDDDRVIDWTKSGTVKIITNTGFGSGFVVSDHVIATAAHCVYDYKNSTGKSVSKILLFDSNGNQTISVTPVEYHVPFTFINAVADHNYRTTSDYALITVSESLENYNNFSLGVPLTSFDNSHSVVTVTGFPGTVEKSGKEVTVNTTTTHMMYSGNGQIYSGDDELIRYTADTSSGNSGGPVYITESFNGETYYTVVGINIAHPVVTDPEFNIGTRMTTDLIHFYNNKNIQW